RDRAAESRIELREFVVSQIRHAASPVRGAVNRLVMNDHQLPIRAPADIELQPRRAPLQSFSERNRGVFPEPRITWRAPVSDYDHPSSLPNFNSFTSFL